MYYILFTTTRCNKCPDFKSYVKDHIRFKGIILDEVSDEFADEISKNNVISAPTLIIYENDLRKKEIFRTSEIYEVKEFLCY